MEYRDKQPNKLNVLVLASTYPRWKDDSTPSFVETLSHGLSMRGMNITVLAPHCQGAHTFENLNGIDVHRFRYAPEKLETLAYKGGLLSKIKKNSFNKIILFLFLISETLHTIKLANKLKINLIHAHWIVPQGLIAIITKKIFFWKKISVLITAHGGDVYGVNNSIYNYFKDWVCKNSDGATAVSNAVATHMKKANNLFVRSMGVDAMHHFLPPVTDKRKHLLFVGRLVDKKGCDILLMAFKEVLKHYPSLTLKIIGDGPEKKALKKLCRTLKISGNVEFMGALSQEQLTKWYQSAKIFIMPSIIAESGDQEGLGLVAAEAMACECPVIASNLHAITDLIKHDVDGILINSNDSYALAEAIVKLAEDPITSKRLASEARKKVLDKFDWSVVAEDYARIIKLTTDPF